MLRLHCFSNYVKFKLDPINEEEEVYGVSQIKEFEEVSQLDKEWLAEFLEKGTSVYMWITLLGSSVIFNFLYKLAKNR